MKLEYQIEMSPPRRFAYFVQQRLRAHFCKEAGEQFRGDHIIANYRFCNIDREQDAVTRWIKANVRDRYKQEPKAFQIAQLLAARCFNEPWSLQYILPIEPGATLGRIHLLREHNIPMFRGAYIMPVHGDAGKNKVASEYYLEACLAALELNYGDTLEDVALKLQSLRGVGPFLANQVCTDLRYCPAYSNAPDWETFVLAGPGTKRGLNRYFGRPTTKSLSLRRATQELLEVRACMNGYPWLRNGLFRDPNNLSNSFCEFDKYQRALEQHLAGKRISLKPYNPK